MQDQVLANLVLGTVIVSLLFLGAMRRLYLVTPAPSSAILGGTWNFIAAGVALVKVNLFRHAVMHLVGIVLAAYFLLVGWSIGIAQTRPVCCGCCQYWRPAIGCLYTPSTIGLCCYPGNSGRCLGEVGIRWTECDCFWMVRPFHSWNHWVC